MINKKITNNKKAQATFEYFAILLVVFALTALVLVNNPGTPGTPGNGNQSTSIISRIKSGVQNLTKAASTELTRDYTYESESHAGGGGGGWHDKPDWIESPWSDTGPGDHFENPEGGSGNLVD